MSFKNNIAVNYVSQIYLALISIATLPQLMSYIGDEAYGLVSFFTLVQSWLVLLDMGMSPTLSREISRFRAGAVSANSLLRSFKFVRKVFVGLAILFVCFFWAFSDFISLNWLKAERLQQDVIVSAVSIMSLIIAFRWISGIYKAAVVGFEALLWLGIFNIIFATLRFVVVFLFFYMFGVDILVFFCYQLAVSILEVGILIVYVNRILPTEDHTDHTTTYPWGKTFRFSLTIAFTSAVWVIVTQSDKLILSKMLTLAQFGYYSMAVQVAGGIILLSGPISSAILPRLTMLEAEGKHDIFIQLYRNATQLIVVLVGSISLVIVFFPNQILYVWTGDLDLTKKVSPYLSLYSAGNLLLSFASFPYYLQYAKGNLRYHLLGNIGFLIVLFPSLFLALRSFGGIGAGYVWIGINAIYFFLWIPIIHRHFERGLNKSWYFDDIFKILTPGILVSFLLSQYVPTGASRTLLFFFLLGVGIVVLITSSLCSLAVRSYAAKFLKGKRYGNN